MKDLLLNEYQRSSSQFEPDLLEKTANLFLKLPRSIAGRVIHVDTLEIEDVDKVKKVASAIILFSLMPLTIPLTLVGSLCALKSQSHQQIQNLYNARVLSLSSDESESEEEQSLHQIHNVPVAITPTSSSMKNDSEAESSSPTTEKEEDPTSPQSAIVSSETAETDLIPPPVISLNANQNEIIPSLSTSLPQQTTSEPQNISLPKRENESQQNLQLVLRANPRPFIPNFELPRNIGIAFPSSLDGQNNNLQLALRPEHLIPNPNIESPSHQEAVSPSNPEMQNNNLQLALRPRTSSPSEQQLVNPLQFMRRNDLLREAVVNESQLTPEQLGQLVQMFRLIQSTQLQTMVNNRLVQVTRTEELLVQNDPALNQRPISSISGNLTQHFKNHQKTYAVGVLAIGSSALLFHAYRSGFFAMTIEKTEEIYTDWSESISDFYHSAKKTAFSMAQKFQDRAIHFFTDPLFNVEKRKNRVLEKALLTTIGSTTAFFKRNAIAKVFKEKPKKATLVASSILGAYWIYFNRDQMMETLTLTTLGKQILWVGGYEYLRKHLTQTLPPLLSKAQKVIMNEKNYIRPMVTTSFITYAIGNKLLNCQSAASWVVPTSIAVSLTMWMENKILKDVQAKQEAKRKAESERVLKTLQTLFPALSARNP